MPGPPWPAPAKINLFLHITGRRPDGYHELQTVFQFLDYGDELVFSLREDGRILRGGGSYGIAEDEDLAVRAARTLQAETGATPGVEIGVTKHIPTGGGLGGGSSDAATVLVALNRLWETGLGTDELAAIGLGLGADVPVFIHGHAAWAEGVGEKLVPVDPPQDWYLILHPGCSIPTASIFNAPDLTRNTPPITIRDFLAGAGQNDCEPVVFAAYPEVAGAAQWLREHAGGARLTGTGACLFARCASREEAAALAARIPPPWRGFAARGLNRSPLLERLHLEGA
ncbi:MAG: 4-(cytidine 5'-diphospho)-2-C-methyl-D-erythritol kinase [Gammaproteobacteria bacterium]|jgi:4-diphosphocytidyl-2-C-methyl-D-erythritol kinase